MAAPAQIVIFSKDRPAQLELLLRSLHVALQDPKSAKISILYRSQAAYQPAYRELARQYGPWSFVDESGSGSFKAGLLSVLEPAAPVFIFLVDDQVFLRPFKLGPILNQFAQAGRNCATVSLRLHPGVDYSYCFRTHSPARTLVADALQVRWAVEPNNSEWSVVMSLDGNLYRREDIFPILNGTDYNNPCFLEHRMVQGTPFADKSHFLCQREPMVVTVPLNQTQDTHHHRHSGLVDLASLNQAYLDGARIALLPYWETTGRMVHREQVPILLSPRRPADPATEKVVADGRQPLAQLLGILEHAAGQQPRPTVQVAQADTPGVQTLLQAYRTVLNITMLDGPVPTGVEEYAQTAETANRERVKAWAEERVKNEQRVMAGPQNPLSTFTWKNVKPVPPPHPTLTVRLRKWWKKFREDSYRNSRQWAYDQLAGLAWRLGKPAAGGLRDKVVTLFAGRPAVLAEVQRDRPPLKPWRLING
jgi:hypothetical protein